MSLVVVDRPGIEGMVTDVPASVLRRRQARFLAEATLRNAMGQRRGWTWPIGDTAISSGNALDSVARVAFKLGDVTRNIVTDDAGDIFIVPASGAATKVYDGSGVSYMHACTYQDEAILCADDGETPLRRYSGAGAATYSDPASTIMAAGEKTIAANSGSWSTSIPKGAFATLSDGFVPTSFCRVEERNGSTSITVIGWRAGPVINSSAIEVSATGMAFPSIPYYTAGTVDVSGGLTVNGSGTKWAENGIDGQPSFGDDHRDAILFYQEDGTVKMVNITTVTDDDTLGIGTATTAANDVRYAITRRCPYTHAAVHRESLWGCGVKGREGDVFVLPPGQDLGIPPGVADGEYVGGSYTSIFDDRELLADFYPVPSQYDGDPVKALIPTPGPMLACKEHALYAIHGGYGSANVQLLAHGAGTVDRHGVCSSPEGQFMAGREGVWWYRYGQLTNLVEGKEYEGGGVENEWLEYMSEWGSASRIAIGAGDGYLVVSADVEGDARTYAFDLRLRACAGRWSNMKLRHAEGVALEGEPERLLAVSDDDNRIRDILPAINGSGSALDGNGTAPVFEYHGPSDIGSFTNLPAASRLLKVGVTVRFVDTAGQGSSVDVRVAHTGKRDHIEEITIGYTEIDSEIEDVERYEMRRVGVESRYHQVRMQKLATQATEQACQILRIQYDIRGLGPSV